VRASPPRTWPRSMRILRRAGLVKSPAQDRGLHPVAAGRRGAGPRRALALGGAALRHRFCDRHAGVERHCLNTRDCSIRPVLFGLQQAVDHVLGRADPRQPASRARARDGQPPPPRREAPDRAPRRLIGPPLPVFARRRRTIPPPEPNERPVVFEFQPPCICIPRGPDRGCASDYRVFKFASSVLPPLQWREEAVMTSGRCS